MFSAVEMRHVYFDTGWGVGGVKIMNASEGREFKSGKALSQSCCVTNQADSCNKSCDISNNVLS